MLALNHGLTGMLTATVLPLPAAVPAAFASHFILDFVPHYGVDRSRRDKSKIHRWLIHSDVILALGLNIPVIMYISWLGGAYHRWDILICGWVAASPDFSLVYYYFTHGRTLNTYHNGLLKKLHLDFHYERPWLIIPELILLVALAAMFINKVS